ncbi:hypothetical protein BGZ61DRAFT_542699 [Ilyonectria robusta]|uniref:uncharacterized protein n=1 Tax=Ilyonectria robusta TaxID=1079257 RepID=UPI001E8CAC11|nr:uncharacterized protein BGZ61DRAFT_542699 [Ilyonectria robusta]KAH8645567.1 hypothetical protein BGZ61DRAFT_542699 [Ilyonectria robusta]
MAAEEEKDRERAAQLQQKQLAAAAIASSQSWLYYYPCLSILICATHGYAVADLPSHLLKQHTDLSWPIRQALAKHYSQQNLSGSGWRQQLLHKRPEGSQQGQDQDLEEAAVAPFAGLPIHYAFRCRRCPSFLTVNWKLCKTHCSQLHAAGSEQARAGLWYQAPAQTFFTQPARRSYFPVNLTAAAIAPSSSLSSSSFSPSPSCSMEPSLPAPLRAGNAENGAEAQQRQQQTAQLVATIQQQWEHEQGEQQEKLLQMAEGSIYKHEITNWLRRTGWVDHFGCRDLGRIHAASRMPQQADEPDLQMLVEALDRVFFRRCIAGLGALPHIGRLYLASPHLQETHSRPFGPLQEKDSMDRYLRYSKRFLCYCLRVRTLEPAELATQHALILTPMQRGQLARLARRLEQAVAAGCSYSSGNNSDEDEDDEGGCSNSHDNSKIRAQVEEEVLQALASFWMQRLPADPFASPLWHFVAVLGINKQTGQLQPAHLFTGTLAGLVYTGRAVVAEAAIPSSQRAALTDLPEQLHAARESWLCKTSFAPMGYILSLLLYGRKIAMETGSRLAVLWNAEGTLLYYHGQPLAIDSIRQLVARMTADAEDLLWERLLFRPSSSSSCNTAAGPAGPYIQQTAGLEARGRFLIPLAAIRDDLTQTQRGQSFMHTNGLLGREKEILQSLVAGPLQKEFLDSKGEWKWPRVQRYLQQVKHFQELLLVLIHLTNQPLRGPEITGLQLVNGINRNCSVFIIDGKVVLVSQYHKSLAHFNSPKAAGLSISNQLNRVVIDECHLTFTAALSYRTKLKGLIQLQGLACLLIFLTGTLLPYKQAALEAAMLL